MALFQIKKPLLSNGYIAYKLVQCSPQQHNKLNCWKQYQILVIWVNSCLWPTSPYSI